VYLADEASGPDRVSTLVLTGTGSGGSTSVRFSVLRTAGPRLGDAEVLDPDGGRLLEPVVSDVVAGRGESSAARLADFGIRYVLVPPPATASLVEALDGQAGLVRASAPVGGAVWRVDAPTARVRLVGTATSGEPPTTVPSGPVEASATIDVPTATRVLLAELADAGWVATLDGVPLAPTTHAGGLQAFVLPQGTGTLRLTYDNPERSRLLLAEGVAAAVALVLMLPPARRRRDALVGELS
jgi:hypothetical protein